MLKIFGKKCAHQHIYCSRITGHQRYVSGILNRTGMA
uniref:Uncharacterized protein n=1 Tax=Arundo donax TaxID=35708 RepID=A0A0A9C896_ARUDO